MCSIRPRRRPVKEFLRIAARSLPRTGDPCGAKKKKKGDKYRVKRELIDQPADPIPGRCSVLRGRPRLPAEDRPGRAAADASGAHPLACASANSTLPAPGQARTQIPVPSEPGAHGRTPEGRRARVRPPGGGKPTGTRQFCRTFGTLRVLGGALRRSLGLPAAHQRVSPTLFVVSALSGLTQERRSFRRRRRGLRSHGTRLPPAAEEVLSQAADFRLCRPPAGGACLRRRRRCRPRLSHRSCSRS